MITGSDLVQQLVTLRVRQHLTQADIANRTGVSRSTIARFETRDPTPTHTIPVRVAAVRRGGRRPNHRGGQNAVTTPIYDLLTVERRFSPFRVLDWPPPEWWLFPVACPICNHIDASRVDVEQFADPICIQCWQRNRHLPEAWREWHCHDCDKFLESGERMVLQLGAYQVMFLCREHFTQHFTQGHQEPVA